MARQGGAEGGGVAASRAVCVGRVTHVYPAAGAAAVRLEKRLALGDRIHVRGHTTDFLQAVERLERSGQALPAADAGAEVALAVVARVRVGDRVYRLEAP